MNLDEEPASKKRATELEKLWKTINENPTGFQAWTELLQYIDQNVTILVLLLFKVLFL